MQRQILHVWCRERYHIWIKVWFRSATSNYFHYRSALVTISQTPRWHIEIACFDRNNSQKKRKQQMSLFIANVDVENMQIFTFNQMEVVKFGTLLTGLRRSRLILALHVCWTVSFGSVHFYFFLMPCLLVKTCRLHYRQKTLNPWQFSLRLNTQYVASAGSGLLIETIITPWWELLPVLLNRHCC